MTNATKTPPEIAASLPLGWTWIDLHGDGDVVACQDEDRLPTTLTAWIDNNELTIGNADGEELGTIPVPVARAMIGTTDPLDPDPDKELRYKVRRALRKPKIRKALIKELASIIVTLSDTFAIGTTAATIVDLGRDVAAELED